MQLKKIASFVLSFVRTRKADFFILAGFVLVAIIWWYPLSFHVLNMQLEQQPIDSAYNQWIIAWGNHALTHYPWRFFDANMFYPFNNTLAWGDNLFSITLLAMPLIPIFGLLGAYNIILITSPALSAFTLYILVRYLTKSRFAGVLAGLIWGFTYFRYVEAGHIQIQSTEWIPLVFLFAEKIRREGSWKNVIWFVVVTFLMLVTNVYLALFCVLSFGIYTVAMMIMRQIALPNVIKLAIGWASAAVLSLPLYLPPYLMSRSNPLERGYNNQIALQLHNILPWPIPGHIVRKLIEVLGCGVSTNVADDTFGIITYILLIIGLVTFWRFKRNRTDKILMVTFLIIAVVSLLASAGPTLRWHGQVLLQSTNPFFSIPYHFVPGYKVLRLPMRWFLFTMLGLAVIGGYVAAQWTKRVPHLGKIAIVIVCAFVIIVEQSPLPQKIYPALRIQDFPAYQWLRAQPGKFAILEFPIYAGVNNHGNDIIEGRRMILSTYTWKKKVSGAISPDIPSEYVQDAAILSKLGRDPSALALLQQWQVKYVVFLPNDYADLGLSDEVRHTDKELFDSYSGLHKVVEYPNGTIYQVEGK